MKVPDRILKARDSGKLVPFLGAGVSCQAGLPDWRTLKNRMSDMLVSSSFKTKGFRQFLRSATGPQIAESLQDHLTKAEYEEWLQAVFDPPNIAPAALHLAIARLPCRVFITTNFDNLLETAIASVDNGRMPVVCTNYQQLVQADSGERRIVIKLHGTIDDTRTIIFSQREYDSFPMRQAAVLSYMKTNFDLLTMLFVGYSFSDPDLAAVLSTSMFHTESSKRDDFMISNKMPLEAQRLWASRNVKIIPTKAYSETIKIIDQLGMPKKTGVSPKLVHRNGNLIRSELLSGYGGFEDFVPVLSRKAASVSRDAVAVKLFQKKGKSDDHALDTVTIPDNIAAVLDSAPSVLIGGPPGSGKTLALQIIGVSLKQSGRNVFFLPLGSEVISSDDFPSVVSEHLIDRWSHAALDEASLMLTEGAIVLLDGLDDLEGKDLPRILRMIGGLNHSFPRTKVVMTARDNFEIEIERCSKWRIAPMTQAKLKRLVSQFAIGPSRKSITYEAIHKSILAHPTLVSTPFLAIATAQMLINEPTVALKETSLIRHLIVSLIRRDMPNISIEQVEDIIALQKKNASTIGRLEKGAFLQTRNG